MSEFNAQALGLARQYRSFSQKELAEKVNIQQASLSKMEKGDLIPSTERVLELSKALNVPISFFQQTFIHANAFSFHAYRKKSAVSKYAIERVLAEISIKINHLNQINDAEVSINNQFLGFTDYKALARSIREAFGLSNMPIVNLSKLVEDLGITIIPCNFDTTQVDGLTSKINHEAPIIFMNMNQPPDRWRFSLAHELCHCLMHVEQMISTPEMEKEANEFAAELLMPETATNALVNRLQTTNLGTFYELKKQWKVSMAALIYRAKTLGKISDAQYTSLFKQMSMRGFRTQEPQPFEIEMPTKFYQLLKTYTDKSETQPNELFHLNIDDFKSLYPNFYPQGVSVT